MKKEEDLSFVEKFGIIILIAFFSNYMINFIIQVPKQAYISYVADCHKEEFVKDYPEYEIAGTTTTTNVTNSNATQVKIMKKNYNINTLRHEYVHVKQIEEGRAVSCDKPLGIYLAEFEAYMMENIPTKIFELRYTGFEEFKKKIEEQ